MRLLIITDNGEARGLTRDFQRHGDGDGSGLEHCKFCIIKRRETWRILVRKHGDDARKRTRGTGVDRHDTAPGDRALHWERVRHAFDRVLESVSRCAGDLLWTIDAVQWRANGSYS